MERTMMTYEEFVKETRVEDYDDIDSITVLEETLKASPGPMKQQSLHRFSVDPVRHDTREKSRGLRGVLKTPLKRLAHSVKCGTQKSMNATYSRRKLFPVKPSDDVKMSRDVPVIQVRLPDGSYVKQPYKGQVLLSLVHDDNGVITLSILEAKHLKPSRGKTLTDAYFAVYVKPEETKPWVSDVIRGTNNPQLQKEIPIKVKLPEDHGKRIVVTVWDFGSSHQDSVLMGSMAFDMVALLKRREAMHGWFYLLDRDLGMGMNLLVTPSAERQELFESNMIDSIVAEMGSSVGENFPEVSSSPNANTHDSHVMNATYNHHVPTPTKFTLRQNSKTPNKITRSGISSPTFSSSTPTTTTATEHPKSSFFRFTKQLCRLPSDQGFGIALKGASPAMVTHVEPGSASHDAGLTCGDLVMEVCGRNVAGLDNHRVGRLIRQCDGDVVTVTVCRHMPIIGQL